MKREIKNDCCTRTSLKNILSKHESKMDYTAFKQRLLQFWNDIEAKNGTITSEEFLQEHNYFYKRCMENFANMKTIHDCIVEVLTEKVNQMERNLFMLCASHVHGICAPVNRFYVADGQPNIYQIAQSLLPPSEPSVPSE